MDRRLPPERELQVSRDGRTVVFHAALDAINGPRAIHVVRNDESGCAPVRLDL